MRKFTTLCLVAIAFIASSCCGSSEQSCSATESKLFTKRYTNADFYKDGVFQEDVAKKAYMEMFEFYNYPMTATLDSLWWVSDFGFGDFENCGMGGVFWVNDYENGYFAHDMHLLPGQMVPEHNHKATDATVAKIESWMVRNGYTYNFLDTGEVTEGAEELIPVSQRASSHARDYFKQTVADGPMRIKGKVGDWHFTIAGPNGAIVHEYANYQDNAGMSISNPLAN